MAILTARPRSERSARVMFRSRKTALCCGLVIGWVFSLVPGDWTRAQAVAAQGDAARDPARTILLEVTSSTWVPRGRTLTEVGPGIRNKLRSAGFTVVSDASVPHAQTLSVAYREARGRQYRIDTFGTEITCRLRLEHAALGTLLDVTVRESSGEQYLGTPPYIEAIQEFETNPYVYFLADLVKGRVVSGLDVTESLIEGLERLTKVTTSGYDPLSAPHSMTHLETGWAGAARNRTIVELGRLGDPRAVPLLTHLLTDSDPKARRLSAVALGAIGAVESGPALERAATADGEQGVREAAVAALSNLAAHPAR